jgi:hypothetical protein
MEDGWGGRSYNGDLGSSKEEDLRDCKEEDMEMKKICRGRREKREAEKETEKGACSSRGKIRTVERWALRDSVGICSDWVDPVVGVLLSFSRAGWSAGRGHFPFLTRWLAGTNEQTFAR